MNCFGFFVYVAKLLGSATSKKLQPSIPLPSSLNILVTLCSFPLPALYF